MRMFAFQANFHAFINHLGVLFPLTRYLPVSQGSASRTPHTHRNHRRLISGDLAKQPSKARATYGSSCLLLPAAKMPHLPQESFQKPTKYGNTNTPDPDLTLYSPHFTSPAQIPCSQPLPAFTYRPRASSRRELAEPHTCQVPGTVTVVPHCEKWTCRVQYAECGEPWRSANLESSGCTSEVGQCGRSRLEFYVLPNG